MEPVKKQGKHFVLVHGACHGSWCWYKVKPLLEAAGQKITTLDMAASGIDLRKIEQLRTLHDYTLPLMELMESLPEEEKVILVGHSLGGMNLSLAMEKYPQKIYAAVFLAALLPDAVHTSSYVLDQLKKFEFFNKPNWQGQEWGYNQQNTGGVDFQECKTGFQESASGVRNYFPKDVEGFKKNPHAQNGNFLFGYGSLSSRSSDFRSRKDYQSTLVDNRNDNSYSGGNSSNLLRSSGFKGGLEAQPSGNDYDGGYLLIFNCGCYFYGIILILGAIFVLSPFYF
ncbi:Methylesterase 1 [Capsicum annuum]|nr:Methylesterase 1 [Capsicum annuum]KAF3653462.1 Methylesterase 1 [Capsicum annuum]